FVHFSSHTFLFPPSLPSFPTRRSSDLSARSPLSWRTRLGWHQLFSATSRFQRRMLVDAFGRGVTDIRVSVTKRCNFGCIYCHDEGLGPVLKPRMPHEDEMSVEEIQRLLRIAREFDIRSVKFTGGEPLIRLDMEDIIDRAVRHMPDVSMTTNGSMVGKRAEGLRSAGLKRVNVSIDSLDPAAFQEIRKGQLAPVLLGIKEALRVGLKPVKLNMVVFKQTVQHIPDMIDFISDGDGLKLQLIQFMPELVGQQDWMVDIDSLKKWLEARADKVLVREMHHRRIYLFNGAEVEVVDPVYNAEFCMNCHRIRVTHAGELKGCLNRNDDLLPTRGLDDQGGRDAFRRAVVLITGFPWTFVAFEIILITLVLPVIGSESGIFDLGTFTPRDPFAYGAVAAATLVGSLIGSLTLGRLSDARGRRFLFRASVLSYSVFTALTALSFNVPSLFVLRMLAGVGLGGLLVIDPAILSEYLPPQHRGRYMVLLDFFWPAGFLVAIAFWYVFV